MKKIFILAIIAAAILGLYFLVFSSGDWNDDSSVTSGDSSGDLQNTINLTDQDIKNIVFNSLPENIFKPEFNGKIFCANHIFGFEEDIKEEFLNVYIFAYCEEYYLKGEDNLLGRGIASPLKMIFKYGKDNFDFEKIVYPKDGSEYEKSISDMFPEKYIKEALDGINVSTLIPSPKIQADNYYKGKLEVYF